MLYVTDDLRFYNESKYIKIDYYIESKELLLEFIKLKHQYNDKDSIKETFLHKYGRTLTNKEYYQILNSKNIRSEFATIAQHLIFAYIYSKYDIDNYDCITFVETIRTRIPNIKYIAQIDVIKRNY